MCTQWNIQLPWNFPNAAVDNDYIRFQTTAEILKVIRRVRGVDPRQEADVVDQMDQSETGEPPVPFFISLRQPPPMIYDLLLQ